MSTDKLDKLLDELSTAMLVTQADDGQLRSRPMHITDHDAGAELVFATAADSGKVEEIRDDARVNLAIAEDNVFCSISGTARVSNDRGKIRSLWSKPWEVWFPEGPDDPDIRLIVVQPQQAEYWDQSGMERLEFLWEAGKALLNERAMDTDLSGHDKVDFPG